MDGSTAQSIATGSQDFAALAGLFCTDGVERDILATQYGYGSVVVSSMSILGLLGLVKSTLKVALGLEKCKRTPNVIQTGTTAGFRVDTIRGWYGFLPDEVAPIDLVDCDVVDVMLWDGIIYLRKKKQYLQKELNPIVGVGGDCPGGLHGITAVNLGNAKREKSFAQHPIAIAIFALVCSGATAWLLLIVTTKWCWVTYIAVPGLHASLLFMLTIPLLHDLQTNRPATHITAGKYKALYSGVNTKTYRLRLLQCRLNGGDVIHFRGNTDVLETTYIALPAFIVAAFCAVAYVCQYAVLKSASSGKAFIWIGCQAALALVRVGFWTANPTFDDPKADQTEYALVSNEASKRLTFAELICAASSQESKIDIRVWEFLASNDICDMLSFALELEWDHSTIPLDEKTRSIPLLFMDIGRIMRNRSSGKEKKELEAILDGLPLRLGLYKNRLNYVRPFLMTETSYKLVPSDYSHALRTRWCWVEITKEVNTFGYKPCRGFAVKEDGDRNHLDVDDLKTLADKMRGIAKLREYLRKKARGTSQSGRPDVYLTATPGTTTRKGLYYDPEYRHGGTLSDKGFDFERGVTSIANYIDNGISSQPTSHTTWKPQSLWISSSKSWKSVVEWFHEPMRDSPQHQRDLLSSSGSSAALRTAEMSSITSRSTLNSLPASVRTASPFHFV